MNQLLVWDTKIFFIIYKFFNSTLFLKDLAIFLASYLIWIMFLAVLVYWSLALLWSVVLTYLVNQKSRATIKPAVSVIIRRAAFIPMSLIMSGAINYGLSFFWIRARPFANLKGVISLIAKSPQSLSFPSDHATTAFALAGAVYLLRLPGETESKLASFWSKYAGIILLGLATLVAIGRIGVGVHYPLDVLVGAGLGWAASLITAKFLFNKKYVSKIDSSADQP